ncbi:MAG: hypothetical protein HGN29_14030 [Asgard group archaeon]|nr:hypothetical protein [Asgard group archaeon]
MKIKQLVSLILIICIGTLSISALDNTLAADPIATLILKTEAGGIHSDYASYVAIYLDDISIDVNIILEEWSVFVGTLLISHDFDLAIVNLNHNLRNLRSTFYEYGFMNIAGFESSIPYCNLSDDLLELGLTTIDFSDKQTAYNNWQQLIMDKIVPALPFFSARKYTSIWSNLEGYDLEWQLSNCLPYMEFNGLHEGQVSTNEFIIHDAMWSEMNPLFQDDDASEKISSLVTEPMLQITPGGEVVNTGIINDWEQDIGNPNLFSFTLRDNIFWNPSFNVTERTSSSAPLLTETSPDVWEVTDPGSLMSGLKSAEVSDGTNQQIMAKDAVFTLLAWSNLNISEETYYHEWISDIYVDSVDSLTFWVEIDDSTQTIFSGFFSNFWDTLNYALLPEFFLNSTNPAITYSDGGVKTVGLYDEIVSTPQWVTYSESVFGCGKYMLDYYIKNSVTILQKSPFWMGIGSIDGTAQDLDFQTISIRVILDFSSALAEYLAGKLDLFEITNFPVEREAQESDPRFVIHSELDESMSYLFFNLRRALIGDIDNYIYLTEPGKEEYTKACAIRKAICYTIDREEINTLLHNGDYHLSQSIIPPYLSFWYNEGIFQYSRDLNQAEDWLEAAGYIGVVPEFNKMFPLPFVMVILLVAFSRKKK